MHCIFLQQIVPSNAMDQFHSYSEVAFFGVAFLGELKKASPLKNLRKDLDVSPSVLMFSLQVVQMRYMLNIVTQLDKASTAQLQRIYKQLPLRYLVDSLALLGNFVSWYLLVYLTWSKSTVNKVLMIIIIIILLPDIKFRFTCSKSSLH